MGATNSFYTVKKVEPPQKPVITKHPPKRTFSHSATFRFKDATSGVTFQCRIDGKLFAACKSPKTYKGLKHGKHTFRIRAHNTGGFSPVASFVWTIL